MARTSTQQQCKPEVVHDIHQLMANLATAISHLSFASKPRPHLFDLPQEIQNIIFDLAYPPVEGFKPVIRWHWNIREKGKRKSDGSTYTIQPFPPPKVSQFLVSKRFFLAAAKAFIGNQAFTDPESPRSLGVFGHRQNIVTRFMTKAKLELRTLRYIGEATPFLPSLRFLTLTMEDDGFDLTELEDVKFDSIERRYPWEQELTDKDIRAVASYYHVERMAGVTEFCLICEDYRYRFDRTKEQKLLVELNVHKLENHIKSIVLKPRQSIEKVTPQDGGALYPGSKGSWENSETTEGNIKRQGSASKADLFDTYVHQLPNTVEDVMALLKEDGGRFMDLIGYLKLRESQGRL